MTIIAAVKTGTDLVISADSKITTWGLGGVNSDGSPIWLQQTYDYGTKIAFCPNNYWTVAVAGQGSFGEIQVTDIVENYVSSGFDTRQEQDKDLMTLVTKIDEVRTLKYEEMGVSKENILPTSLFFFSSDPQGRSVRAWLIEFGSSEPQANEILTVPSVHLLGSYDDAFTLLYGYNIPCVREIAVTLNVPDEEMAKIIHEKTIPPIRRVNTAVMPLQDAIDFAAFLVKVQIQMQRFLPGIANCGGSIDIAVIRGLPRHEVIWLPGKEIKHPGSM